MKIEMKKKLGEEKEKTLLEAFTWNYVVYYIE